MYSYGHFTMMHNTDFYPVLFLLDEEIKQELQPERIVRNRLLTAHYWFVDDTWRRNQKKAHALQLCGNSVLLCFALLAI